VQKIVYKLLTCIILMNILFQFNYSSIIYAVTSATTVTQSTTSGTTASTTEETIDPDQDVTNADDDNLGADINDDSGTLLGPLVEIVRAIGDAIMSILTKCMLGTSFESMMVSWDEVDNSKLLEANTSKTYTESEINEFKNAFGNLPDLKYPNFKYTPEEIFKGEIDVFGIDFIGGNTVKNGEVKQNESTGWNSLRKMVSIWYQVLRYIAVIGLLSILIYLGIKIILSSSAGKKAEYKSALINWVIAMFLIFIMHYIMAFIIVLIQKFTTLLGKSIGNIKVTFGDKTFITNFMGLARFQAQENSLTNQLGYVIIYIAFITLTFKFTFIYFKRMLKMAILTLVAPLVAMMYPLDKKGGGKARGFDFWLKEYIYTALLQPVHLLLYNLLIGTAVNPQKFLSDFIFYIIFTPIITIVMNKIMFSSEDLMMARDGARRINAILQEKPLEECEFPNIVRKSDIKFNHVTFTYPGSDRKALDDISLEIKQGSTVALVGPSGGGKTTIASLIPRFFDVDSGEITIGGINVKNISNEDLMNHVSFVFQNTNLFKTSLYENIKFSKQDATKEEVINAAKAAQCEEIFDKMPDGINTVVGSSGVYLSGGEAQRIALARAILKEAPIVLLDEATAFADPENEHKIQKAFEVLTKNKTVLMIAHRLSTVKNADKIIVIEDGQIKESGTHEELLSKNNLYAKMWEDYKKSISWKVKDNKNIKNKLKSNLREESKVM